MSESTNRLRKAVLVAALLALPALAAADGDHRNHPFYPVIEDAVAKAVMRNLIGFDAPGEQVMDIACIETPEVAYCVDPNTPYERMLEILHNLPTAGEFDQDRYWRYTRWVNTVHGSTGQLGEPITLTYSFLPDGTPIAADGGEPSELYAILNSQIGSEAAWKQIFADCFADWSSHIGITYIEVSDDGASFPNAAGAWGYRGDVRIGGHHIDGASGTLAYDYFPDTGDMVLDTDENWAQGSNYRFFRNVVMHEHGHGMGLGHPTPNNHTKLMEAYLNTNFLGPQEDDIRGGSRNYGDCFEEDDDAAEAIDLGTWEMVKTVMEHNLDYVSDHDWFEFHTIATTELDVTLDPLGSYQQLGHEGGPPPQYYYTDEMMDLGFKVYDENLDLLVYQESADLGDNEILTDLVLGQGTYYLEVLRDASSVGADVQRYNLLIWLTITDPTDVAEQATPASGLQASVFPNPFNPKTTVRFFATQTGESHVDVYDMSGRLVDRLTVSLEDTGWVQTEWDGLSSAGEPAASGIYLMKVISGRDSQTVRAVLLK